MRKDSVCLQREIRLRAARIISMSGSSHIGSVFSIADILALLYGEVLHQGKGDRDDVFILSKGHACAGVYAALNVLGVISDEEFSNYASDGSVLMSHISHKVPGVEFSTGSLGHGLPFAVGKALAARLRGNGRHVYVILSDGELDEGSNWEAILSAAHLELEGLTCFVDRNRLQSLTSTEHTLALEPLREKFQAFGWKALECDGHNLDAIALCLAEAHEGRPKVVICETTKGHPVDFMRGRVEWHYRAPNAQQLIEIDHQVRSEYP